MHFLRLIPVPDHFRSLKAFISFLYLGDIEFAPLYRSGVLDRYEPFHRDVVEDDSYGSRPSARSIYRLADKVRPRV